jgi:hypothetical protein
MPSAHTQPVSTFDAGVTVKPLVRLALIAGLVPLPWFLFWTAVGGMLAPGYGALSQHASELLGAGGGAALCARISAFGSGLGFIAFALGLMRLSRQRPAIGAICYLVFGISRIAGGIWPMGSPLHGLYMVGILNIIAPALAHIELDGLVRARRFYRLTAFVSVAGIVYLWLNLTGNDVDVYRGLTQRVFSSINSLWPFVLALAVLRTGAGGKTA